MKLPSQRLLLVVASAALVFAGCAKKPARPDPSQTAIGPAGGGAGLGSVNPLDVATSTPGGELSARDAGFDANGQNRTALAANTVYFDFDRSDIKASERPKLQAAKEYLEQNPGVRLLLEGRADWRGTAEYNLALGDRRANSARNFLAQTLGVPADRLETLSKGSLEAIANADDATAAKDRRVDLVVVSPNGGTAPLPGSAPAGTLPPAGGL